MHAYPGRLERQGVSDGKITRGTDGQSLRDKGGRDGEEDEFEHLRTCA